MGKPVVTTLQAFEGIKAVPDEEIITAESEESFAAAVINLLKNPAQAQRIGEHARLCVEKHYSWENNLHILDKLLLEPIS